MSNNPRILMVNEGTYPNTLGGVSTWCDILIKALPEIDFYNCCITSDPLVKQRYELPPNVRKSYNIPIWGTLDPHDYNFTKKYSQTFFNKINTKSDNIVEIFIPLFEKLMDQIFSPDFFPQITGDIFFQIHCYLQEYDLVATFKHQAVWEIFQNKFVANEIKETGVVPPLAEITESLRILFRFISILEYDVKPVDIVHATAAGISGLVCLIAKYKYGTPIILTEHGIYLREQYLYFLRTDFAFYVKKFIIKITEVLVRMNYFLADMVSPVCHYNTRWEIRNGLKPERIMVIHNGVDPQVFKPQPHLEAPKPTIVSTVRIDPLKDLETLIKAVAVVREKVPDIACEIYGTVSFEDYFEVCKQLIFELGLTENIKIMGHTANPTLVYNRGHVIALSSLSEAFPYTVIEAMMCGRPVVATDVGGVREALEDVGILVEPKNPEQFGQACTELLLNRGKARYFGQEARERALSYFSINSTVTKYKELYNEMLRSSTVKAVRQVAASRRKS